MKTLLIGLILLSQGILAQTKPDYYETDSNQTYEDARYDIRAWCQDRIRILTRAQNEATRFIYRGQFDQAIEHLRSALVRAYTDIYTETTPLSQQMLLRAIKLSDTLEASVTGQRNGQKAITYFLDKYIDYIKHAMNKVDIPYYQVGRCGYCRGRNSRDFEQAIIEIARLKLELVNDTLIHSREIVPIGPSLLYLKASEVLSYYSRVDLENSLFANYYACQIDDLDYLHQQLKTYNTYEFPRGIKGMVYQTFNSFENIIGALSLSRRCY